MNGNRHRTAWALSHPERVAILDHLKRVVEASGQQVAEMVGLSPAHAAYQLRVLRDAELVVLTGTEHERGVTRRFYAAAMQEPQQ